MVKENTLNIYIGSITLVKQERVCIFSLYVYIHNELQTSISCVAKLKSKYLQLPSAFICFFSPWKTSILWCDWLVLLIILPPKDQKPNFQAMKPLLILPPPPPYFSHLYRCHPSTTAPVLWWILLCLSYTCRKPLPGLEWQELGKR